MRHFRRHADGFPKRRMRVIRLANILPWAVGFGVRPILHNRPDQSPSRKLAVCRSPVTKYMSISPLPLALTLPR